MTHEFVIVGAGLAGATTAWHLARRGVTDVVLLEQEATPGVHSSGRNACFIREHAGRDLLAGAAPRRGPRCSARRARVLPALREPARSASGTTTSPAGCRPRGDARCGARTTASIDVAALLARYLAGARRCATAAACSRYAPDGDALRLETTTGRAARARAGQRGGPVGGARRRPAPRPAQPARLRHRAHADAWTRPGRSCGT